MNAGAPILIVQAILGHKWVDTTLSYARLYDGTVAADYYAPRLIPHLAVQAAILVSCNRGAAQVIRKQVGTVATIPHPKIFSPLGTLPY
jgi:hypothetical protein